MKCGTGTGIRHLAEPPILDRRAVQRRSRTGGVTVQPPVQRRSIDPADVAVHITCGRWGSRRVRVTECAAVLKAEDVYTALLRDEAQVVMQGASGSLDLSISGRPHVVAWEIRPNALWRRGRVFLQCDRCSRRCTRLYLPRIDLNPACPNVLGPDVRVAEPSELQGHLVRAREVRADVGRDATRTRDPGYARTTGGAPRALAAAVRGAPEDVPRAGAVLVRLARAIRSAGCTANSAGPLIIVARQSTASPSSDHPLTTSADHGADDGCNQKSDSSNEADEVDVVTDAVRLSPA